MTLAYRSALMSGRSAAAADFAMACAFRLVLLASLIPSLTAALITKYSTTKNTIAPMASHIAACIAARVASASSSLRLTFQFMFSLPGLSCPFLAHSGRF